MRSAFVDALVALAERDTRVCLLTGDLGFTALEPFAERFPDRFVNVGVAEQNMVGLATGLADAGYVPFVYSIATFATMRPYEFVRNGPVLHELPVRIVGVGGGLDYGHNGVTHYALEDIAIMRAQPDLTVLVPADVDQARAAVTATGSMSGPAYLRLAKQSSALPGLDGRFALGDAATIGSGEDVALVVTGSVAHEVVAAGDLLAEQGVSATVVVVSTFNPSPIDDLARVLARVPLAIAVEEHYPNGGLGSFVAETAAESAIGCRVVRRGVPEIPRGMTGSRERLLAHYRLDPSSIAAAAVHELTVARP